MVACAGGDFGQRRIDLFERILVALRHQRVLVKETDRVGAIDWRNQVRQQMVESLGSCNNLRPARAQARTAHRLPDLVRHGDGIHIGDDQRL